MRKSKLQSLICVVGATGVLLQLYLFVCGCGSPVPRTPSAPNLYSAKCGSCHGLLPPQAYTAETWEYYVRKYGKQMTPQQKQQVLSYLTSNAAPEE